MNVAATAVAAAIAATNPASQIIDIEDFAELMEQVTITETTDLGNTIVYKATHPTNGELVMVNTSSGRNLVLQVA